MYVFLGVNIITLNCLFAEIRNGYTSEIQIMRESLKRLNSLLIEGGSLPLLKKQAIKQKVDELIEAITYLTLTEELLDQFRAISPGLYHEIDNITNCRGRPVDVYVKFVSETQLQPGASATTNLARAESDLNVYQSEYGPNTVSIKIATNLPPLSDN